MSKPDSRLLFFCLALALLGMVWGCAQTDDITAAISLTNFWLDALELPEPPPGMVYELWVSKEENTDTSVAPSDVVSLGRFSYISNDTLVAFLDTNSTTTIRPDGNKFVLQGDVRDYKNLLVSIERSEDNPTGKPGPIMLMEEITGATDTLHLRLPMFSQLWRATARYNMECVTDSDRAQNDFHGLWFSTYQYSRVNFPDTFGIYVSIDSDYTEILPIVDSVTQETLNLDELTKWRYMDFGFESDTVRINFGPDTIFLGDSFLHRFVDVFVTDSIQVDTWPISFRQRTILYQEEYCSTPPSPGEDSCETIDLYEDNYANLDIFSQDSFAFPVYDDYGWKYQGWAVVDADVIGDEINTSVMGRFTEPSWVHTGAYGNELIPGYEGYVLTTGKFSHIDQPDDNDPFTYLNFDRVEDGDTIWKRPMVPGEDFLNPDSLQAWGWADASINLMPDANPNTYGSVFISLEPANKLESDTMTNFPLMVFLREFPSDRNSFHANGSGNIAQQNMQNLTRDDRLPVITVIMQRQ